METQLTTRNCGAMEVHRRLLNRSATYRENRASIESKAVAYQRAVYDAAGREGVTTIPVVVHVVHHTDEQNVSAEQIASQITALNRDYRAKNADVAKVPDPWKSLVGDTRIQFALATVDPTGKPTEAITRTRTHVAAFADDDVVKFTSRGGADAWPSARYLNVWVCPMIDLLGYSSFPGGPADTDGVVVDFQAFGTTGTAQAPFDLGRTATHEIGHWLNLYHIWGDDGMGCAGSDLVDDTPNQAGPNKGLPAFPSITCDNAPHGDMFVNYMDYTDDAGMVMFTNGQIARMHAALDGPRATIGGAAAPEPEQPEPEPEPTQPGAWRHTDLTAATGAPDAAGDPAVAVAADGTVRVVFRGLDEHIHELRVARS